MKTKKQTKEMCKEIACSLTTAKKEKRLNEQYIAQCWEYIARLAILDYDKKMAIGIEEMLNTIRKH